MKQEIIQIKKQTALPKGYAPKLGFTQTETAIKLVKDTFETKLAEQLSLIRVSAPRLLITGTGLQDDLAGTQVPVSFTTKFAESPIEIVHSLAKWKRHTLGKYGFQKGTGLYTDMDAIRKDEDVSPIHSVYVDQWDWELVIIKEDRSIEFLRETVKKIYQALLDTEGRIARAFPQLSARLPKEISFVHAQDLETRWPDKTPKEREHEITKELGAVFLIGIGHPLESGQPHDVRAADYDDWIFDTGDSKRGLNGDILVWDHARQDSLELSSMGIRVDADALHKQLDMHDLSHRKDLPFQKGIMEGTTPLSIGGGIGQSRLCMLLLQKAHIGEVQSSVWPESVENEFDAKGVPLL